MDPAAAETEATATATDRIVEAVIDEYNVPDTGEEREFVTTTTRRVVERFVYNAQTRRVDVAKTVQQTTSMPAALACVLEEAPTFEASREVLQQQKHNAGSGLGVVTRSSNQQVCIMGHGYISHAPTGLGDTTL